MERDGERKIEENKKQKTGFTKTGREEEIKISQRKLKEERG